MLFSHWDECVQVFSLDFVFVIILLSMAGTVESNAFGYMSM